jgi:aspartate/methionine/tyrosine aminotransferase
LRKFPKRLDKIEVSGIRRIFDLVQGMTDAVDLSLGQPHFEPPDPVKKAAKDAIDRGFNRYTVTQGIPALHERLRKDLSRKWNIGADAGLLVTSGTAGGLFLSLASMVEEGDEVLIPDPCFVLYRHLVNFFGGVPVMVDTYPDFRLTPERIAKAVTKRTKLLLFNNPVNPTGVAYPRDEVRAIAEACDRHGLFVISDEIYEAFSYDFAHESLPQHLEGRSMLLGGFSKTYGIPGWRLGYAAGPKDVIEQMTTLSQFTYVCAPSPAQVAGIAALDVDMTPRVREYRAKRDLVFEGLRERYELVKPQGAFYCFPKCPSGRDEDFVKKAIGAKVLVVPGGACSMKSTHYRLSFAADDAVLRRGVEILNAIAT